MIRVTNKKDYFTPMYESGNTVKIAFDYEPMYDIDEDGNKVESNVGTWTEHVFRKRPSFNQIQDFILSEINRRTDELILSGFVWKDMSVWLSTENQFNYKAAYDLAVQTNGANLPQVFKFGDTLNPIYYKFETVEDITDFYTKASTYINQVLAIGWAKKDNINWDDYKYKQ